jgi:hypothetical protein
MQVSGQFHAPAAYTRGMTHRYRFDKRVGGPQSRSEHSSKEKIPVPARSRTSEVQPVAQLLYWLSYPGSQKQCNSTKFTLPTESYL